MEKSSEKGHSTRAVQATPTQSFTTLSMRSRHGTLDDFHSVLHIAALSCFDAARP